MIYLMVLFALLLGGCDDDTQRKPVSPTWQVGPVINGKNYSGNIKIDSHPEGWSFDFGPGTGPHYVTIAHGPLTGKTVFRLHFRVEAAPETIIHGKGCSSPSAVTLYFQKSGDDWSTDGMRWWATFASIPLVGASEGKIVAPLDGVWTSVMTMTATKNPAEFADAKRSAGRVGFTFANCEGYGHGATATGPVKFIVTHFGVE